MVSVALGEVAVLVLDCQATAASSAGGEAMELGWCRLPADPADEGALVQARLLRLREGATVPFAVTRITGLSSRSLAEGSLPEDVWAELAADAATVARASGRPRALAIAHFARFEEPFLRALHARATGDPAAPLPLQIVCTHEIARRLYPELPRRGLRALTGYFGRAVGPLRRAAEHVVATAFVWRHLVPVLAERGVLTVDDLVAWLAEAPPKAQRRAYPMPRASRLSLPTGPGVYRLLRLGGDVLYVGKAASLRSRVNQHFRKQRGVHERALEMLAQARELSFAQTDTALEAALLESDEIKSLQPPYNVALSANVRGWWSSDSTVRARSLWFARRDLSSGQVTPDALHVVGPFASRSLLDGFGALVTGLDRTEEELTLHQRASITGAPPAFAPDAAMLSAGLSRLRAEHPRVVSGDVPVRVRLLGLGTRMFPHWRDAKDEDEEAAPTIETDADGANATPRWDEASISEAAVDLTVRFAHAVRRAGFLLRLVESTLAFHEPASMAPGTMRVLSLEDGAVTARDTRPAEGASPLEVPARHTRTTAARRAGMDFTAFDRLRVLTAELRRVIAAPGGWAAVRVGPAPALEGRRLADALSWV